MYLSGRVASRKNCAELRQNCAPELRGRELRGGAQALARRHRDRAAEDVAALQHFERRVEQRAALALLLDHHQLDRPGDDAARGAGEHAAAHLLHVREVAVDAAGDHLAPDAVQPELRADAEAVVRQVRRDAAVEQRRVERERERLLHRVLPVVHRLEERDVGEAAEQPETDVLDIGEGLHLLHHRECGLRRLRI